MANLATATRPYPIGQVLDTVKKASAAGFNAKTLPGAKIAFVEVTSKTLLAELTLPSSHRRAAAGKTTAVRN